MTISDIATVGTAATGIVWALFEIHYRWQRHIKRAEYKPPRMVNYAIAAFPVFLTVFIFTRVV